MSLTSDPPADRFSHLTDAQRRAIQTIEGSVLVSAAAGSGKTTVLAERCAYLVCDLPREQRCSVNDLLVVTFTDAAAGEMRTRIRQAIRQRYRENPRDHHLREQLHLLDSAGISTIHAFCKSLVQRWFPQAGIDPQAALLSGDEAELLRREVLDGLFLERYEGSDAASEAFRKLIDDYGIGEDRSIFQVILSAHQFINSLPDPQQWLDRARDQFDPANPDSLFNRLDEILDDRLRRELTLQIDNAREAAGMIRRHWPIADSRLEAVKTHLQKLKSWLLQLEAGDHWEAVATAITFHTFDKMKPKPRNLSEADGAAYDLAKDQYDKKVKKLFIDRLQDALCQFSAAEYREGLERIAPYVETIVELVRELDQRYQQAKQEQAAMDFNDLQRGALRLLAVDGDDRRPSEIARQLQKQYRHLLVDEFQDVDPLQEAILRLISRESAEKPQGNLFTVGDIKQSIYRFRLAEPELFIARADQFAQADDATGLGEVITLQENFRSRAGILEAVNLLFRRLMSRDFGGSAYDRTAELHPGASFPQADGAGFGSPAMEMHLLEPITQQTEIAKEDEEDENGNGESEEELEGIEREAFLIGKRIRCWMGDNPQQQVREVAGRPPVPGQPPMLRPIGYGDIVILLRSMPHKAEPIAEVLRKLGIPVRIESPAGDLASTEFQDVYSLLQVLDNRQQDIPLAAVLRSPILNDRFNESDLLRIRLIERNIPFAQAVQRYAQQGEDEALRQRLQIWLQRLERYRRRIHQEPVAEVIWDLLEENQYLAYVSGLPDGLQRRERLVQIHELARQFGRFARQGLRRFLHFLEELVANGRPGPAAESGAGVEEAVRIMTIHASKGLEFPVVILADLQKQFNLRDFHGTVLVDRQWGLAMKVADPDKRIIYPTLLHQLAVEQGRQAALSEELRVLYVALTRAREHLLLVGRCQRKQVDLQADRAGPVDETASVSGLDLACGCCLLDWLLPALGMLPDRVVRWPGRAWDSKPLITVDHYPRSVTDCWRLSQEAEEQHSAVLEAVADLQPLPADEPLASDETLPSEEPQQPVDGVDEILTACSYDYPGLELTTLPARVAVSDLKRAWDGQSDPEERSRPVSADVPLPMFIRKGGGDTARDRGVATHRFLQLLDLSRSCQGEDLHQQLEQMVTAGRMAEQDATVVMRDAVAWFFSTEPGRQILQSHERVQREIAFVSRILPQQYDPMVKPRDERDVVLLRGMVDLVVVEPAGLRLLDYKTDAISAEECGERAGRYQMQLTQYAEALTEIYQLPVVEKWLVFLHPRQIIRMDATTK